MRGTELHRQHGSKRLSFTAISALILLFVLAFSVLPGASALEDFYQINVDLPDCPVQNLMVTATLPAGLIYNNTISVTEGDGTTPITRYAISSTKPNDSTQVVDVKWSFDNFNNSNNKDIIIKLHAVAADVDSNLAGAVLGRSKFALSYECSGQTYTYDNRSEPVVIVEPFLNLEKKSTDENNNPLTSSDTITYDIYVSHAPESEADAYDLVVEETLPEGLDYVIDSMKVLSGQNFLMDQSDPKHFTWEFDPDYLWNGEEIHLQYQATVGASLDTNTELTWTSAEGENDDDRTYTKTIDHSLTSLKVNVIPNKAEARMGDTIEYSFEVENTGHTAISNIALSASAQGTSLNPITLDPTSLNPGEMVSTGPYTYTVIQADCPGPIVCTATATGHDNFLDKDVAAEGSASVILLFDPLTVNKTALDKEVKRGDNVTYLIQIHNTEDPGLPARDIIVEDVFNKEVVIVYAYPPPDEDGKWRFDSIEPGEWINITLNVEIPEEPELILEASHSIEGVGFVRMVDHYSTNFKPYVLRNRVKVTFLNTTNGEEGTLETIEDEETVNVITDPGPELYIRDHGSGSYSSDEILLLDTKNRTIRQDKEVSACYDQVTIGLYNNRSVTYSSRWSQGTRAVNRATDTTFIADYKYLTEIERTSRLDMDRNGTIAEEEAEFEGMGHIGFLKMPDNATHRSTPIFESREDYAGSFKVLEKVDEYGLSAASERSTSGSGLVVVDNRIGESQRSYEHGTGSYSSDEIIETYTNYIAKDISLVYAPAEGSSLKWKEGIYSKKPGTSLIGEEYSGTTSLDKDTVARGLNEMKTEANFSGKARYRAILEDEVDLDEEYVGDYSVQRNALFKGVPKYDRPHLNVIKEGSFHEETIVENHEEKTITVATYAITVENDGNRTLGPIYVTDFFPPGAKFINASARPSERTETRADWVLTHLAIGDRSTIALNLDLTEYRGDELVNRVEACGVYDNERICAANFTALEIEWLTCCPNDTVSVSKTAQLDETSPNVVLFRIELENSADVTRVATVTDYLPAGMFLLDSEVPFSSYEGGVVTWNIIDLGPMENKTIDYTAEALHSGLFENQVRVDPRSVDGDSISPAYDTTVIEIDEFSDEIPPPGWQPPDWDLSPAENSTYFEMCEEVFS